MNTFGQSFHTNLTYQETEQVNGNPFVFEIGDARAELLPSINCELDLLPITRENLDRREALEKKLHDEWSANANYYRIGQRITLAVITEPDGRETAGVAYTQDPENYNAEIGMRWALEDACSKLGQGRFHQIVKGPEAELPINSGTNQPPNGNPYDPTIQIGDPVTYYDHNGNAFDAYCTTVWPSCINLSYKSPCGQHEENVTSVPLKAVGMTGRYYLKGHQSLSVVDKVSENTGSVSTDCGQDKSGQAAEPEHAGFTGVPVVYEIRDGNMKVGRTTMPPAVGYEIDTDVEPGEYIVSSVDHANRIVHVIEKPDNDSAA